jgi:crossover junction endodeoxyribonuclease RuvC
MRILGIDPGIGRCGWSVIEPIGSSFKVYGYGCIETKVNGPHEKRLLEISEQIETIIKKYKPEVLAIEELFFGSNAKTAFAVGEARGVAIAESAKKKLEVAIYNPVEVKIAVTGYGRADKSQIGQMVKMILRLEKMPKLDDTTDALAVALAHAFSFKHQKLTRI